MGCIPSTVETTLNSNIDKEQRMSKTEFDNSAHVLFIGTGDSGKTTIRKQLTQLHGKKFDDPQIRATFADTIIGNLLEGAIAVLVFMPDKKELAAALEAEFRKRATFIPEELVSPLQEMIWNNTEFEEIRVSRQREVQLQDCWMVFANEFKDYPSWGGKDWIPSVDDCIRCRARTTGVVKEVIGVDGVTINIYDVGGQRAERKKWLHSFENVNTVVFVTSLSEYDQFLFEDHGKSRLEDSIELFKDALSSKWLKNANVVLFLNKKDLFDEKFSKLRIPLNATGKFPSAPSKNDDPDAAIKWITSQFIGDDHTHDIATHVTTAVDPSNVYTVFEACKDALLKKSLTSFLGY